MEQVIAFLVVVSPTALLRFKLTKGPMKKLFAVPFILVAYIVTWIVIILVAELQIGHAPESELVITTGNHLFVFIVCGIVWGILRRET